MKSSIIILSLAFITSPLLASDPYLAKIKIISKKTFAEGLGHVCIDGERSKTRVFNKQNVQSYYCDGGPDQLFYLYQDGKRTQMPTSGQLVDVSSLANLNPFDPWFEIRPAYFTPGEPEPEYCLDVAGYDGKSRDNVMYYKCQGLPDQKWKFSENGQIINKKNGLCLDISGYSGNPNTNIMLYHCDGYLDQEWYYTVMY